MRRALARRRRQQLGQGRDVRQRAPIEDVMPSGPHTVMRDGVTADAEVPGDPAIRLAQVQPAENLTDVGHRTPPSRHSSPPGVGVLSRRFRVPVRTRKESGHDPPGGGSLWPTLGGSVWVTLPGSRWATPGGSASPTPVAQYRVAADRSHIRRGTPDGRSGAPSFFYRDPAIPCPARDGRFIALDGPALGFLARPAERGEQPAHMSPVQSHAEGAADDGGNTAGGPEVGVEIPGRGTPQEEAGELPLLRGRQLRWTTRRRFRRQGFEAAPTHHLAPEDHPTVRTPEPAGHLRD